MHAPLEHVDSRHKVLSSNDGKRHHSAFDQYCRRLTSSWLKGCGVGPHRFPSLLRGA